MKNDKTSRHLYQSRDGGLSWFDTQPSDTAYYQGHLKIHPLNDSLLYAQFRINKQVIPTRNVAGVLISGITIPAQSIYKRSNDAGKSWENIYISIQTSDATSLILTLDPTDTTNIYADSGIRLGKSSNSGNSWNVIKKYVWPTFTTLYRKGIVVSPSNNQNLFFSDSNGAFISQDGGRVWNSTTSNARGGNGVLIVADNDSNVMYLNTTDFLYRSIDAGNQWEKLTLDFGSCYQLLINPKNNKTLFCTHPLLPAVGSPIPPQLFKSVDAGNNWKLIELSGFIAHQLSSRLTFANDGQTIYSASHIKSLDNGEHWTIDDSKTYVLSLKKILVDPRDPNTLFSIGHQNSSFVIEILKSTDGGESWKTIKNGLGSSGGMGMLIMHPTNPDQLLYFNKPIHSFPTDVNIAFITKDGGNNWNELQFSKTFVAKINENNLIFNPRNKEGLLAATTDGLFESKDLGFSWTLINKEFFSTLKQDRGISFVPIYNNKKEFSGLKTAAGIIYSDQLNGIFKLSTPPVSTKNKDCLFKWAEQQYPTFFSSALAGSQLFEDYTYRYYNDTNTYLGISQDTKVHLLQADLTDKIKDVGYFEYFQQLAGCH